MVFLAIELKILGNDNILDHFDHQKQHNNDFQ